MVVGLGTIGQDGKTVMHKWVGGTFTGVGVSNLVTEGEIFLGGGEDGEEAETNDSGRLILLPEDVGHHLRDTTVNSQVIGENFSFWRKTVQTQKCTDSAHPSQLARLFTSFSCLSNSLIFSDFS